MHPHTTGGWPDDDAELLASLKEAVTPVPTAQLQRLLEGARAAYGYRTMDEELAALAYDSLLDESPAAARQAPATARTLLFESDAVSVQLEVTDDGVVGQVVAPTAVQLYVERADGQQLELECDETGCFTVPVLAAGPVRLRVEAAGATTQTEWTDLRRRARPSASGVRNP
jgi:hypothetical protein